MLSLGRSVWFHHCEPSAQFILMNFSLIGYVLLSLFSLLMFVLFCCSWYDIVQRLVQAVLIYILRKMARSIVWCRKVAYVNCYWKSRYASHFSSSSVQILHHGNPAFIQLCRLHCFCTILCNFCICLQKLKIYWLKCLLRIAPCVGKREKKFTNDRDTLFTKDSSHFTCQETIPCIRYLFVITNVLCVLSLPSQVQCTDDWLL